MKKTLLLITSIAALSVAMLAGCATQGKFESPQQIAAQVCPGTEAALAAVAPLSLDPKIAADLIIATKATDLVCGASAAINTASLTTMANTALPSIVAAIKASPLHVDRQNALILDVTVANAVINAALAGQPATAPAASVPAPSTVVVPVVVQPVAATS